MPAESLVSKENGSYDLVPVFVGLIKDGVELREVRREKLEASWGFSYRRANWWEGDGVYGIHLSDDSLLRVMTQCCSISGKGMGHETCMVLEH